MDRNGRDVNQIIEDAFPKQVKAMLNFRLYLSSGKKDAFNKAWSEYCHYEAEPGKPTYVSPYFAQYHGTDGKLAVERIHKLLQFVDMAHKFPLDS